MLGHAFSKKRLTSAWLVETLPPPPLPSHLNHLSFRFVLPSRVISSISTSHWLPTFQADTSHMSVASVHAKALIAAKAQLDATTSVGDPPTPSSFPLLLPLYLCISPISSLVNSTLHAECGLALGTQLPCNFTRESCVFRVVLTHDLFFLVPFPLLLYPSANDGGCICAWLRLWEYI